ncbi:MAG: deoxynucleoside kinase [Bacteriovoracia bacterium]
MKLFLTIVGNIGAGKTTLTKMLSEAHGWEAHFEAVTNNPYLEDFYKNMSRWSFPIQIFFLNSRYQTHQKISKGTRSAIQDRSIYEDAHIFARNLYESGFMEKRDYFNYLDIYNELVGHLNSPDLMVYLRKSLPKLKENVAKRGRDYEADISEKYLSDLNRYYDEWIEKYKEGKVLVIDSDNLDFVNNQEDFNNISKQIFDHVPQTFLRLS